MRLRWLLALVLAVLMTSMVIVVATTVGLEAERRIRAGCCAQLESKARHLVTHVDRHLFERWLFHRFAGDNPELRRADAPEPTAREALRRLRRSVADFAAVAIVDADGTVALSEPPTAEGRALDGRARTPASPAVFLAPSLLDAGVVVVPTFLVPLDAGPRRAMLATQLDWRFIGVVGDFVRIDRQAEHGIHVLLATGDAILEATREGARLLEIAPATRTALAALRERAATIGWDGRQHLGVRLALRGERELPALPLDVIVLQDVEDAFVPVTELHRRILFLGAGFVALSIVAGWWLAGWIATPLDRLATAAMRADVSGRPVELPRSSRYVEVALLGEALSHMLMRIEEQTGRLAAAFKSSLDAVVVIDERGRIGAFNESAERIFGHAAADVIGKDVGMLMSDPHATEHDDHMRRYLETGERKIIGTRRVMQARRSDGSTFPCELMIGESLLSNGRRIFTGYIRDLSSLEEVQMQLRMAQAEVLQMNRLITVGQVGSHLSHELNQPLGAVMNYAQAARHMLASPEISRERLDDVLGKLQGQVMRASEILQRLRDFLASSPIVRQPENVNVLVEQSLALAIIGPMGARVRVETRLAPGLPRVVVDRTQIEQMLVNLIRNAVEAMAQSDPATLEIRTGVDAGFVVIEIADRGPGIDPTIADRLFAQFVTTKPGGLGLGLSICRSIVEDHGGKLTVRPNPLGGTIFSVSIPCDGSRHAAGA